MIEYNVDYVKPNYINMGIVVNITCYYSSFDIIFYSHPGQPDGASAGQSAGVCQAGG